MSEIWKDIKGYESKYQISNLGRVKSLGRHRGNSYGGYKTKDKIRKLCKDTRGYLSLGLSINSSVKTHRVHILVAEAFLSHKPNGKQSIVVDHINNIKTDNRLSNIQLISHRENCSKDRKNKSSKYIGVIFDKTRNKYRAEIQINGKKKYLGRFDCETKAHLEYLKALQEL